MPPSAHRPWPEPSRPWLIAQQWTNLLFAHWCVPHRLIEALLPPGIPVDLFEGSAWVSVTPFQLRGLRLRGLPPVPGLSGFPELNFRTYVSIAGKPGVWFFSLDAASGPAVAAARSLFRLPYHRAKMNVVIGSDGTVTYHSRRERTGATFDGVYRPAGHARRAVGGSLDHWLVERYCLYAMDDQQRLYRTEINHEPWALQPAECEVITNTIGEPAGIDLSRPPDRVAFSARLDVVNWLPERVTPSKWPTDQKLSVATR
jgi:uncharacterized protein